MRKLICQLLFVIFTCIWVMGPVFSIKVNASGFENATKGGKESFNLHRQDYRSIEYYDDSMYQSTRFFNRYMQESYWYRPVVSYLFANEDGTFNRVESIGDSIYSEIYSSDYRYQSGKRIKLELNRFGGVYRTNDAYYVMEGSNNTDMESNVPEFRVIKYDRNWNKLASNDLTDANTINPYKSGSCRFAEENGMLYVYTCHVMYGGHQASVIMKIDMDTLEFVTAQCDVAHMDFGFTSHSFNQFVAVRDGELYTCAHCDAYPREIALIKFDELAKGRGYFNNDEYKIHGTAMYKFSGEEGDNETGATLGGFELSKTHAIVVGDSVPQSDRNSNVRNIYMSTIGIDKLSSEGSTPTFTWITNYSQKGKRTVTNPHMVKINDNKYMLMWEEYNLNNKTYDRTCYVFIDGTGKVTSSVMSVKAYLSDCAPIVVGDRVVWYVTRLQSPVFFSLPIDGDIEPAKKGTVFTKDALTYKVTKSANKNSKKGGKLTVIGWDKKRKTDKYADISTVIYGGYTYEVTAIGDKAFRKCKNLAGVTLYPKVVKIGKQAFEGCTNIITFEIRYTKFSKKNIGKNAFKGIKKKTIYILPKKKKNAYKKLLIKRGASSKSFYTS